MTARLEERRWWRSQLPHLPSSWNVQDFNTLYVILGQNVLVPYCVHISNYCVQFPIFYVCCDVATNDAASAPGVLCCLITTVSRPITPGCVLPGCQPGMVHMALGPSMAQGTLHSSVTAPVLRCVATGPSNRVPVHQQCLPVPCISGCMSVDICMLD